MTKTHTKMRAGLLVAVYVHDGQGRRLVIAAERDGMLDKPLVLATTQAEAKQAIAALTQLLEKLPTTEAR